MQIRYRNSKIANSCTNYSYAKKKYGVELADRIFLRVKQLSAVNSIEELIKNSIGRCHLLKGERSGQFALDLLHPYRSIFVKVKYKFEIVEIIEIVDYH